MAVGVAVVGEQVDDPTTAARSALVGDVSAALEVDVPAAQRVQHNVGDIGSSEIDAVRVVPVGFEGYARTTGGGALIPDRDAARPGRSEQLDPAARPGDLYGDPAGVTVVDAYTGTVAGQIVESDTRIGGRGGVVDRKGTGLGEIAGSGGLAWSGQRRIPARSYINPLHPSFYLPERYRQPLRTVSRLLLIRYY